MHFFVVERRSPAPDGEYPFAVLRNDTWDDYTFKTLFIPSLHVSATEVLNLDGVKITRIGQMGGRTPIEPTFDALGVEYCSLGVNPAYYDRLLTIPSGVRNDYLASLRDVTTLSPSLMTRHMAEEGFRTSLLRNGSEVLDYALGSPDDSAPEEPPQEADARLRDAVDLVSGTTSRDVRLRAIRQALEVLAEWSDFDDERRLFSTIVEAGLLELEAFVRDDRVGRSPETILESLRRNIEHGIDWANTNRYLKFAGNLAVILELSRAIQASF